MRLSVKSLWRRQSIWKNSKELSLGHLELELSRTCLDNSRFLGPAAPRQEYLMEA